MKNVKELLNSLENKENLLMVAITTGILLLSFGIYLVGSKIAPFLGSRIIIFGSALSFLSVVLLVFFLD